MVADETMWERAQKLAEAFPDSDIAHLLAEIEDLREIVREVADADVIHDSNGGLLFVATPDALIAKARALLNR